MTFNTFLDLFGQHWALVALVLCPIVVVMMALSALTCEACGAPFGIFRRRNRTIDLCVRCALLHDIRRATEVREEATAAKSKQAPPAGPTAESKSQERREAQREQPAEQPAEHRRYTTQSPVELGVAGYPGAR